MALIVRVKRRERRVSLSARVLLLIPLPFCRIILFSLSSHGSCKARHRHQEFLAFLRHLDQNVPAEFDVHLIIDNYATHKHAKVRAWLVKRPRYHIHYTPTYSSWSKQVERWFGLITQRAIRRGSLSSVKELVRKIDHFVEHYNTHTCPFVWTVTAESILAKVERLCAYISGTAH